MEINMNSEELLQHVLDEVEKFNLEDIPNIDLYMDQVTTYLNNKFKAAKRYDDDKLLTKTMINNYAKSKLLPAPEKKKYTKDHILILALIYFFKNVISINDVTKVLKPLETNYFHNEEKPLDHIINVFLDYVRDNEVTLPLVEEFKRCDNFFDTVESDNKEYLRTLGLIGVLSYDMFIRKILIEKLVDSLPDIPEEKESKGDKKEPKTNKETSKNDNPKESKIDKETSKNNNAESKVDIEK